jgi:hypothetical protein
MANVDIGRSRWRTIVMVLAPVVLLAVFVAHPYLPDGYRTMPEWPRR